MMTKGFTLIEVMISIFIMAFVTLGMYTMIDDGTKTRDRIISRDQSYLQVQMALQRISQDFTQIYSALYYAYIDEKSLENSPQQAHNGHRVPLLSSPLKGQIMFFTSSNRRKIQDNKESRYAWVHYLIRSNAGETEQDSSALIRRVLSTNPYDQDPVQSEEFTEQRLLNNVSSIQFQFWDPEKKEFHDLDNIDRTIFTQMPPRAMKVFLTWTDNQGHQQAIEYIARPLYPFFDIQKDKRTREKFLQDWQKKNNNQRPPGPPSPNTRNQRPPPNQDPPGPNSGPPPSGQPRP